MGLWDDLGDIGQDVFDVARTSVFDLVGDGDGGGGDPGDVTINYPDPPAPRDIYSETYDSLQAQLDILPQQLMAEATYGTGFALLDARQFQEVLGGRGGMLDFYEDVYYPSFDRVAAASNTASRTADVADVEALGTRATEAYRSANPELDALLTQLYETAGATSGSELSDLQEEIALRELQNEGQLTPAELRSAEQAARAASSARGMAMGNDAIAAEVLSRYDLEQQRQAEARAYAMSVEDQRLRRLGADRAFLGQATSLSGSLALDPSVAVLGRPSTSLGYAATPQQFANTYATTSGPSVTDPQNAYASALYGGNQQAATSVYGTQYGGELDMWNTQYNAAVAQDLAAMNNEAAIYSAILGGAGAIAGA